MLYQVSLLTVHFPKKMKGKYVRILPDALMLFIIIIYYLYYEMWNLGTEKQGK